MAANLKQLRIDLNTWLAADNGLLRGEAKFYSKHQWRNRGEEYGKNADLTLVIEGSPLYAALNHGEPSWDIYRKLNEIATRNNYYWELGHAWSVHFYPT